LLPNCDNSAACPSTVLLYAQPTGQPPVVPQPVRRAKPGVAGFQKNEDAGSFHFERAKIRVPRFHRRSARAKPLIAKVRAEESVVVNALVAWTRACRFFVAGAAALICAAPPAAKAGPIYTDFYNISFPAGDFDPADVTQFQQIYTVVAGIAIGQPTDVFVLSDVIHFCSIGPDCPTGAFANIQVLGKSNTDVSNVFFFTPQLPSPGDTLINEGSIEIPHDASTIVGVPMRFQIGLTLYDADAVFNHNVLESIIYTPSPVPSPVVGAGASSLVLTALFLGWLVRRRGYQMV
jgi:hypothetical protein